MDWVTVVQLLIFVSVGLMPYLWLRWIPEGNVMLRNRPPLEVLYDAAVGETDVDIVAVHSLGAHVDRSWTWKDGSKLVHWLKDTDMLPNKVQKARIMAYNYDSRWHFDAPKTRLELCGEGLIESLNSFRRADKTHNRPIIFIGHSLGGLVVLYALLYAESKEELKYIPAQTVGFAALGTPFRGTKMQPLAKIIIWLTTLAGSDDGTIADLKPDNKHLGEKVHAFGELRERLPIPICCFVEQYESDYSRKIKLPGLVKGIVVEEESAHIQGWRRKHLQADHFHLNKFTGPNDRSFQKVSNELYEMYINREKVLEKRKQKQDLQDRLMVPFGRNDGFIGRESILQQLLKKIPPNANPDDCQRTVIEGLGGVGKTQIALEAAYRVRNDYPDCSVFWVPAVDITSFENAYRDIGRRLRVDQIDEDKADVKLLVKTALSQETSGSWLLIIDNMDDIELLKKDSDYLPFNRKGSILFTTRNHHIIVSTLDIPPENVQQVGSMSRSEALDMLKKNVRQEQWRDISNTIKLLDFLANLPLAIRQASAYMFQNGISTEQYLKYCQSSDKTMVKLLSREFQDRGRYLNISNSIATTWLISFKHISRDKPLAAKYLKYICFLAEKDIPVSLLLLGNDIIERDEALGILRGYAFITKRQETDSFDIHRLVRLAMHNWLKNEKQFGECITKTIQHLSDQFPFPKHENRVVWIQYLPHVEIALRFRKKCSDEKSVRNILFNVGESNDLLGRYEAAEAMHREALQLTEKVLGREHPSTLISINNLALVLDSQGKHEAAEAMHREALQLRKKVLGREHPDTLTSMNNLARVLDSQRKHEAAEAMHRVMGRGPR